MRDLPASGAASRRRLPNRRDGLTVTVEDGRELFDVSIGFFDDERADVAELFFLSRGTVGRDFDAILAPLGIAISHELQRVPPRDRFSVDPVLLPPSETRLEEAWSPEILVALTRCIDGARAGNLAGIEISAPDHAGYDTKLRAMSADLTLILLDLPPPRRILYGRPGAPLLLGRQAWSARRSAEARAAFIPRPR